MQDVDINYVAVVVAALVPMFLGALWYSTALFARPWMRAVDRTQEELKGAQLGYVISAVGALLMSYALARIDRWAEKPCANGQIRVAEAASSQVRPNVERRERGEHGHAVGGVP